MTDIRETELILLGPEEWNGVEPLSSSKDVAGRGLTLAFGQHPVLDADVLACERVRPARDVARRKDARNARLEVLVHRDAAIDGEACLFRQGDHWADTDADDDQVGR